MLCTKPLMYLKVKLQPGVFQSVVCEYVVEQLLM